MFKRFVSILLTAIILFAEAGQVVYAHTCFKSNETSFSLYSPAHCKDEVVEKSCCAKKQQTKSEECIKGKESCCGVSAKYVQQSFPTHETELKKPAIAKDVLLPVAFLIPISYSFPFSVANNIISSPPRIGQHSSSFLCIYRC
jgi:hypothetical protein